MNDFFDVLSRLKNRELKIKSVLVEIYESMVEEYERKSSSRTAKGICKIGHDTIRLLNGRHILMDLMNIWISLIYGDMFYRLWECIQYIKNLNSKFYVEAKDKRYNIHLSTESAILREQKEPTFNNSISRY